MFLKHPGIISSALNKIVAGWSEQQKLKASDAQSSDSFGLSVAMSGDGNTAAVGAPNEDTTASGAGSVYIFTRSGSTWTEQQKIQGTGLITNDGFGLSVVLSEDGNTLVAGSRNNSLASQAGAVYVFTRSGSTWTQQQKLIASDAQSGDLFGSSITLSSNGNTLAVGAAYEDTTASGAGSVYVFTRSGSTWTQQQKLQAADPEVNDFFGSTVSLSGDGNTLAVGAFEKNQGSPLVLDIGAVYIFTRSGSTWTQQQKLVASDPQTDDTLGLALSMSGDGNTVAIGAPNEDTQGSNAGAVYIFTKSGSLWSEQQKLIASDGGSSDRFGGSVSINEDGNTLGIAAASDDDIASGSGAFYIFTRSGSVWTEQQKLKASDAQSNDSFGAEISISYAGDSIIVGAWAEDDVANNSGAAYIFVN